MTLPTTRMKRGEINSISAKIDVRYFLQRHFAIYRRIKSQYTGFMLLQFDLLGPNYMANKVTIKEL